MPTPPPRKFFRFQFHLSTAIVMMFVAGGLMWANVSERNNLSARLPASIETRPLLHGVLKSDSMIGVVVFSRGWPCNTFVSQNKLAVDGQRKTYYQLVLAKYWSVSGVIVDACIALILLAASCVICEYLIRRRAAQKGA